MNPSPEQLALRNCQPGYNQCKSSEEIIPRAADGDQLGAAQGKNYADQSDDAAKDHDKPFGSAGWFSPIAKQNDVPQLPEHGVLSLGLNLKHTPTFFGLSNA